MSRYRLYPDKAQEALLLEHCAHTRFVYNLALEQRLMWRPGRRYAPGLFEQARQLTEARGASEWLASGSAMMQQIALRDHDLAWKSFFRGTHGRPRFRKRGVHEGFGVVGVHALRIRTESHRWSSVRVPKIGWIRFRRSREMPPNHKSYRVARDRSGRWHISFTVAPDPIPGPETGEVVGVDRGVIAAVTLSNGEMSSPAGLRPKESERLLRLQRRLARQRKESNRRARTKLAIARSTAKDTDRRKDWVEKTSTDLARRFDVIRVEDLNIRAMTRSARGTQESPGRNVRAKSALNREILRRGWGRLVTRLEHKAPGRVEKIPAAYSSQRCNACGHVASESRESQARFRCVACGHEAHADVNAAKNIADGNPAARRAVAARGDLVHQGRSVKREPSSVPPTKAA